MGSPLQPLSLTTFSRLSLAVEAGKNPEPWFIFLKRHCPCTLLEDLIFIVKIASRAPRKKTSKSMKLSARNMLRGCLKNPQELFHFEKKEFDCYHPRRTIKLFKELTPLAQLPVHAYLRRNKEIMLNHYDVLKYIVYLNINFTVLNNIMILAVLYRRFGLVRLCVLRGADDFDTAGRVASLVDVDGHLIDYFGDVERSQRCEELFVGTQEYRHYHRSVEATRYSESYTRYLADSWLRRHFESEKPLKTPTALVGSLEQPITSWLFLNCLRSLNFVHHFELEYIRERIVRNSTVNGSSVVDPEEVFIHDDCSLPAIPKSC